MSTLVDTCSSMVSSNRLKRNFIENKYIYLGRGIYYYRNTGATPIVSMPERENRYPTMERWILSTLTEYFPAILLFHMHYTFRDVVVAVSENMRYTTGGSTRVYKWFGASESLLFNIINVRDGSNDIHYWISPMFFAFNKRTCLACPDMQILVCLVLNRKYKDDERIHELDSFAHMHPVKESTKHLFELWVDNRLTSSDPDFELEAYGCKRYILNPLKKQGYRIVEKSREEMKQLIMAVEKVSVSNNDLNDILLWVRL